ncbi:MAG: DUF4328 domain-containing protein [Hymenobacter sp.]|nr:MAG: DUF4328 domain-containing protein [Hymenobacter sp.]
MTYTLRDNKRRARTARLVFILLAAASAGLVVLTSMLPPNVSPDDSLPRSTTLLYAGFSLLSFVYLGLLIGSYVALIRWLRRAYYNLHQLPGIYPEYSDGWAAGAWFMPFINFWRPFTIMREVWQDTQLAAVGQVAVPATALGWWWASFILKLIVGRITWVMSKTSDDNFSEQDLLATILDAGAQVLAALLTWYVIGRIARFEAQLTIRQQIDQLGQPAPTGEVPAALAAEQSNYGQPEGY